MDSMKHYSTYQSQFIEMFGNYEMNANFGDLFSSARNGANIKQGTISGGIPITRIETISEGEINRDKMGYAGIVDNTYSSYYLQDGDILVSHINSMKHIGKCTLYQRINDETIIHGMNLLCLRPYKDIVNPQYVTYLLRSSIMRKLILDITKPAVNQASFTVKDLCKLKVMLPPISEQEEFVAIVDQADKSKFTSLKSQFIEMFGSNDCESKPLSDLTSLITKGTTPTSVGFNFEEDGIKYIKAENICEDTSINLNDCMHISQDCHNTLKRSQLQNGDILFSIAGVIGRVGVITKECLPANTNQALAIIRFDTSKEINKEYAKHALLSPFVESQWKMKMRGAAQMNISLKDVGDINIPLPSLAKQEQFCQIAEQADKSKLELLQRMESINYIN